MSDFKDEHPESENGQDSFYSFRFRNTDSASHDGDYDVRRDSVEGQNQARAAGDAGANSGGQGSNAGQGNYGQNSNAGQGNYGQNSNAGQGNYGQSNNANQSGYGQNTGNGNQSYSYRPKEDAGQGGYGQNNYGPSGQNTSYGAQNQGGQNNNYGQSGQNNNYGQSGQNGKKGPRKTYARPKDRRAFRSNAGGSKKPAARFGLNIIKCIVFAVVFGLIAGGIFHAINPGATSSVGSEALIGSTGDNALQENGEPKDSSSAGKNDSSTGNTSGKTDAAASGKNIATGTDVTKVVDQVMPAIVSITTVTQNEYYDFFGQPEAYESQGSGSGIIISDDKKNLYIATNNHVVSGAKSLTVVFSDNESVEGTVKGNDGSSDLAVIVVAKSNLKKSTLSAIRTVEIGESKNLKVGQQCVAIGNALGYGQSVTVGVISALERQVTTQDAQTGQAMVSTLLQTDAAINPGNSGGALLDMNGKLIGINSAKFSDTSVEGMGFAIPVSTAQPILNNLIQGKQADTSQQGYLGITGQDVSESASAAYGIPVGVYVNSVEKGSAAEKAGLQKGDIITKFEGQDITSMDILRSMITAKKAGDEVSLSYSRADNGEYQSHEITLKLGKK